MNIALKDSARDKLMPALKPYMLVGHPSHIGGSINIMQIGKKKHPLPLIILSRIGRCEGQVNWHEPQAMQYVTSSASRRS